MIIPIHWLTLFVRPRLRDNISRQAGKTTGPLLFVHITMRVVFRLRRKSGREAVVEHIMWDPLT